MGISYKGVEYQFAFEFKFLIEDRLRPFSIVISSYREKYKNFTGMCLDNELKVISMETMTYAAFFDIVCQIIEITTQGEKIYAEAYRGKTLTPLMTVKDPEFLRLFDECKKSRKSLEWYEGLKRRVEETIPKENKASFFQNGTKNELYNLYDAQAVSFFYRKIREEALQISDTSYFRLNIE
jgi:hypothetical protein